MNGPPSILTLPLKATPACSTFLCASVAAYLLTSLGGAGFDLRLTYGFGLVPGILSGDLVMRPGFQLVPAWATLLTSLFLHGGLIHLASNMLFLWAVGRPLELVIGPARLVVLYLASGIAGGGLEVLVTAPSPVPVIGASGAISGLFAAYLMLFARPRPGEAREGPGRRAIGFLGVWLILQAGMALVLSPQMGPGGIAIWAHVGGFVAGLVLIGGLARRR